MALSRNNSSKSSLKSKTVKGLSDHSGSGAVDEEIFIKSFDDVPRISIFSSKEVNERLNRIKEVLIDVSQDWEKRNNALREIRSLLLSGAVELIDFTGQLKSLEVGLQTSIKDLRSQVVREACITIAFMAQQLGVKFDVCCESLMPSFISLIQNSAKIMATSSVVAVTFIIKNVPSPRLIPTLTTHLTSKSVPIRKQCLELISLLLSEWPKHCIERHIAVLQEAIRRGLTDADSDARTHSRRAFSAFSNHFPEQGFSILNSFESSKQKQLLSQMDDPSIFDNMKVSSIPSASARMKSLERSATSSGYGQVSRSRNVSVGDGRGMCSLDKPDIIPVLTPSGTSLLRRNHSLRDNDTQSRLTTYRRVPSAQTSMMTSSVQRGRNGSTKTAGVSQSQPTSRSGSPTGSTTRLVLSSIPPDVTASAQRHTTSKIPASRRSAIPHSQGCSREASPDSRLGMRDRVGATGGRQSSSAATSPAPRRKNSLTTVRLVEFGKDLEAAVTDVWRLRASRRQQSDDASSDAGSELSDGGFSSGSGSFRSHTGSDMSAEVADIVNLLISGSWADRREGLIHIQRLLKAERHFNYVELKKLTEVFTRMFHDPHSKVFTVFVDTFTLFICTHSCELVDWYPTCLHRLLNKSGADVLGSLQPKLSKALDALRDSFPHSLQFSCITKFIVEQSQMSNMKLKTAVLTYIVGLVSVMEPECFTNSSDNRLAISRIITWASEPKSPEVRKAAQAVLCGLHSLNAAELSAIIAVLPKSFQEGAMKILNNSQQTSSAEKQSNRVTRSSSLTNQSRALFKLGGGDSCDQSVNQDLYSNFKKTSEDLQHLTLLGGQFDFSRLNGGSLANTNNSTEHSYENMKVDDETVGEILSELSMASDSGEERHEVMNKLINVIKNCCDEVIWDNHFKVILLLVLQTMRDDNGKIRSHAIRVLKELLIQQSERFKNYAELTIMTLLEFEKDADKEAVRAAEDCGCTLAQLIPCDQSLSILNPISLTAEFPINLAAIKMETKVIEAASQADVRSSMPLITPGLVKGFEHNESSVRKSSMLCLIALHHWVEDDLLPYLTELSPSKMKLLNLYIKRNTEKKEQIGYEPTSPQ